MRGFFNYVHDIDVVNMPNFWAQEKPVILDFCKIKKGESINHLPVSFFATKHKRMNINCIKIIKK